MKDESALELIDMLAKLNHSFNNIKRKKSPINYGEGQMMIIRYLADHREGVYPSDLINILGCGNSRIANALKELEKKGFVARFKCQNDKRKTLVQLTDKGREFAIERYHELEARITRIIDEIGKDKFSEFVSLSTEIINVMIRENEEAKNV